MDFDSELGRAIDPAVARGGIGGRLKTRPEDFLVREIPAYLADGRENAHLMLLVRKRDRTTDQLIDDLARALDLPRRDIGVAGMKDRHAVTTQYLTVPWSARDRIDGAEIEGVEILESKPHGNKLRRGHLRGNRFELVMRELTVAPERGETLLSERASELRESDGFRNLYGVQRFSTGVEGVRKDIELFAHGRVSRRDSFRLSVAQAALFNVYLLRREDAATLDRVERGDLLQKFVSGGLFESEDPEVDERRRRSGELGITGPIFGSKTRRPSDGTPARDAEDDVLRDAGIQRSRLVALTRNAPGSRRLLKIPMPELEAEAIEDDLGQGLRIRFDLPAGSFATVLLRELTGNDA